MAEILRILREPKRKDWTYKYTHGKDADTLELGFPLEKEAARRAGAWAIQLAAKYEATDVELDLGALYSREIAEGIEHGSYSYDTFKENEFSVESVSFLAGNQEELDLGMHMGEATNYARDLINAPPNVMNAAQLSREARALPGVTATIRNEKWLRDNNMNLVLAVNAASAQKACMIELRYRGAKDHIAIVGKGVTFDSGGLSLKPSGMQEWMKMDMGGGAAVLAIFKQAAEMKLKVNLRGYIPCVENAVGGNGTRPGDVIVGHAKKSVEVMNTDAEGRLILADALSYASSKKPAKIIDMATLTGAVMIGLGNEFSGLMGDEKLAQEFVRAGKEAGDPGVHLPLVEEYRRQFDSDIADIRNHGKSPRYGGAQQAATFLREFVGEDIPWVHIDIAGTAFREGGPLVRPHWQHKGANGGGVRMVLQWLRNQ